MTEYEQIPNIKSLESNSKNYLQPCCFHESENPDLTTYHLPPHHMTSERCDLGTEPYTSTTAASQLMGRWADEEDEEQEEEFVVPHESPLSSSHTVTWDPTRQKKLHQKSAKNRSRPTYHSRHKSSSSSPSSFSTSSSSFNNTWRRNNASLKYDETDMSEIWNPDKEKSFQAQSHGVTNITTASRSDRFHCPSVPPNNKISTTTTPNDKKVLDQGSETSRQPSVDAGESHKDHDKSSKCQVQFVDSSLSQPLSPNTHQTDVMPSPLCASTKARMPTALPTRDETKPSFNLQHLLLELSSESLESEFQNRNVSIFGSGRPRDESQTTGRPLSSLADKTSGKDLSDKASCTLTSTLVESPATLKGLSPPTTNDSKMKKKNAASSNNSKFTPKRSKARREKKESFFTKQNSQSK